MKRSEHASFFERLKKGLQDSIAHSRAQLNLRTTTLPAPPPPVSARDVAALRHKLNMSQVVFAATLNVSPRLVQSWEQGLRKPIRGDLRLIELIQRDPRMVQAVLRISQPGRRHGVNGRKSKRASAAA
jgi:putative transcriptional regulator